MLRLRVRGFVGFGKLNNITVYSNFNAYLLDLQVLRTMSVRKRK